MAKKQTTVNLAVNTTIEMEDREYPVFISTDSVLENQGRAGVFGWVEIGPKAGQKIGASMDWKLGTEPGFDAQVQWILGNLTAKLSHHISEG